MKNLKISIVMALMGCLINLSSCNKKHCHKPDEQKSKHECHHADKSLESSGE